MTTEEIIRDLKSDRIKKMIVDCDAGADGDDQFALAYALMSPHRVKVVAANSAPFNDPAEAVAAGEECRIICNLACPENPVPAFEGSAGFITETGGPIESPAAENIRKTVLESDEPVYIVISGCCTNVASALALYPEIREKLVVVWLGLNDIEGDAIPGEYNYCNDIEAGKMLFALAENMVLVSAGNVVAPFGRTNEQIRHMFGEETPLCRWLVNRFEEISWAQGLWDFCAEGLLICPEAYEIKTHTNPYFDEKGRIIGYDEDREIVCITKLSHDLIVADAIKALTGKEPDSLY